MSEVLEFIHLETQMKNVLSSNDHSYEEIVCDYHCLLISRYPPLTSVANLATLSLYLGGIQKKDKNRQKKVQL